MKTLVSEHKKVVDFYKRNSDVFNYPGAEKSARYAFTEIAEVVDAIMREENPEDLRRTKKDIDSELEIGDTMFMLLASLGVDDVEFNNSMRDLRFVLHRQHYDDFELAQRTSPIEVTRGVDHAISEAAASIARAMVADSDYSRFTGNIANAIGVWDWNKDRLDQAIAKLEQRCREKRALLQEAGL